MNLSKAESLSTESPSGAPGSGFAPVSRLLAAGLLLVAPAMAAQQPITTELLTALAPTPVPTTAPLVEAQPVVRVYVLWGQSHMFGIGTHVSQFGNLAHTPWWAQITPGQPWPVMQGCYIFDKLKRGSSAYESFRTTDLSDLTPGASGSQDGECATIGSNCDSHFGEAHLLRPLTVGYADTFWGEMDPFGTYCQAEDSYPWLPCTQEVVTDPSVGPENAFADTLHELTGDTIVVIKFCISGSSVVNLDQFNVPSWNPTSTNPDSYMPTMLDTYLDQGIQQAINLGNTLGQEVYFCGIASLIGTSDTRNADQAIIHRTSYGVCMDTIRDFCALQTHGHTSEEIPYLLLQSPAPPGLSLAGKRNFKVVRLGQYSLSISKPNVTMIDTEPILQLQGIHSDAAGYSNLGIEMAYWAWGRGEAPTVRL